MEDYFIRTESKGYQIYGILDGHAGIHAAYYAKNTLTNLIINYIQKTRGPLNFKNVLPGFFSQVDAQLKIDFDESVSRHNQKKKYQYDNRFPIEDSGSTCLILIVEQTKLTYAHLGDCRAVLFKTDGTLIETIDYTATTQRAKIEAAGGFVYKRYQHQPWRVNHLETIRTFGDFECKKGLYEQIITAVPEVNEWHWNDHKPKFIILASDGLWKVVTSQRAAEFINARLTQADFGVNELAQFAIEEGSADNISIIIIRFGDGIVELRRSVRLQRLREKKDD